MEERSESQDLAKRDLPLMGHRVEKQECMSQKLKGRYHRAGV